MQVVDIVVAEMHVNVDLALTELKLLKKAMDNCTVSYNSSKPEDVEYYTSFMTFYELVKGIVEGADNVVEQ